MKKLGIVLGGVVALLVVAVGGLFAYLKSMDFNQYKGLIAEQAKAATGRDLKFAGDIKVQVSLTPSLSVEGVSFSNASWGSRPEMAKLRKLDVEVALMPLLSKQVQVNRLVLEGLDLLAETDKQGRGNWEFGTDKKDAPAAKGGEAAPMPVVKMVRLKDIKIAYKDGKSGQTVNVGLDSLDVAADDPSAPLAVKLAGAMNGVAYKLDGKVGSVPDILAGKPMPVSMKADLLGIASTVDGRIGKPLEGKGIDLAVKVDVPKLADTVKAAAALAPDLKDAGPVPAVPVSFAGKVTDTAKGYAVDGMKLTLGGSDLSGRLAVALGGARPAIEADLASNLLNVDELAPPSKDQPAPAKKSDGRVFPNDPLPLDGLKAADAKVKFAAKKIVAQGNTIENASVDLTLANGKLTVNPLGLVAYGGKIGGTVTLDGGAATPTLAAKLNVDHLDYSALLKQQGTDIVQGGKVDVAVDVRGAGKSVRALMAGLNGETRIASQGGKINSNALNIGTGDVAALLPMVKSEGDKDIRCAVVHLDIAGGLAKPRSIVVETGGLSVIGTGTINLATEGLNLKVEPRAKKTSVASLAEVTMLVGGTFANPDVKPDPESMGKAALGTAATVGAAVATGGVSLLGQGLAGKAGVGVDENDYCTPALAGKTVVPGKTKSATDAGGGLLDKLPSIPGVGGDKPAAQGTAAPTKDSGNPLSGITSGVKGIFGK
jgi:uncharacterized protein involved in outer membrane biogenesis